MGARVVAGPDTATDKQDNDLLAAVATPEPPAKPEPVIDPRDQQIIEMRAQMLQMQAQLAARPGEAPRGAGPAEHVVVVGEKVFRTEFPMHAGVELGDGLHQEWIRQTADRAVAAGYTTRGGAHRIGFGTDDDGNRTAIYEIYARR